MQIIKQIQREPVLFQMVIQSIFPVLIAFGIISLDQEKLGTLYAFTAALLSFITRMQVTPLSNPRDNAGNLLIPR